MRARCDASACVRPRICSNVNSFGSDFDSGPWTLKLCLKDSDGDGQPNGFELGDPCCICRHHPPYLRHHSHCHCRRRSPIFAPALHAPSSGTPGSTPEFTSGISNPGAASSTSSRNCSTVTCSNGVQVIALPSYPRLNSCFPALNLARDTSVQVKCVPGTNSAAQLYPYSALVTLAAALLLAAC